MSIYNNNKDNNLESLLTAFENSYFENKRCIDIFKTNNTKMQDFYEYIYKEYNKKLNIRSPAKLDIID